MIDMAKAKDSMDDLTVAELRAVAEEFAVDLDGLTKKAEILKAVETDGVTYQMYKSLIDADPEETVELAQLDDTPLDATGVEPPEEEERIHVVRMTRKNHTFEIRGYKFSKGNPFALVTEEDADFLVETGGFRMASPKELKEYYGQG